MAIVPSGRAGHHPIFKEWRGKSREAWWEGPHGEPFREFHTRVTKGIERLLEERGITRNGDDPDHLWNVERHDDRRFVIVAHNGTNSVILSHLLGIEPQPWEWERLSSNHAAIWSLQCTVLSRRPVLAGPSASTRAGQEPGAVGRNRPRG